MSKENILEYIEIAIDNNWPLRPIKGNRFINIDNADNIELTDRSHILDDVSDLKKYPAGCTGVAIIPALIDDFVCLDLDFKNDPDLEKEIYEVCLASYKKEDLFIRTGNPEKPGQIWFRTMAKVEYHTDNCLDVFTTQKRCDALGAWKGDGDIEYTWPFKKFWEYSPEDLPIIRPETIDEIIEKVKLKYGTRKKDGMSSGGRHDGLLEYARGMITPDTRPSIAMTKMMDHELFKELLADPRKGGESPHKEISRIVSRVILDQLKDEVYFNIEDKDNEDRNSIMKFAEPDPPKVEENSFFDLLYRAIRRNQRVDNKKIAFATTLNLCSWLASLFARYEGLCPNLMILYVAESGGGKSSTTKITKQIVKHIPELRESFRTSGIGSSAAIARFISESPVCNLNIDEFSKVLKNQNKEHMGDLPEILCQWYSDFDDYGIPEAVNSLKAETNGLAIGAKLVSLMSTTPAIFNNFHESLFEQGLGRRLFPIIDNSFSPLVKNFDFQPNFFKDYELKMIKRVVDTYILQKSESVFDEIDITKYKFVKKIEKGETEYYNFCKKSKITLLMRSSKELDEHLKNGFIDETNDLRKRARYFGSSIQSYLANSRIESVKKLAAIHTIFGKTLCKENVLKVNSIVEMDSFEWATKTFGHYVIHEAMESYDEIFNKKSEIKAKNDMATELLSYLSEKNITEFTKSTKQVHNFFKDKKNSKLAKTSAINNLIESDKLILVTGNNADSRGATFRITKGE